MSPPRPTDPLRGAKYAAAVSLGFALFFYAMLTARGLPNPPAWLAAPAAVGFLTPLLYWTRYRAAGFVPPAAALAVGGGVVAILLGETPPWLAAVSLAGYTAAAGGIVRAGGWGPRVAVAAALGLGAVGALDPDTPPPVPAVGFGIAGSLLLAFAWVFLFRPFFELCVEPVLWLGYNVRGAGPGLNAVPPNGPLLVVANHACWWDPLFVAKVLPRPITPMMTAKFFDVWFLRPLMVRTFRVIRVAESTARREAPEIHDAVRALDAGEIVVLFPEGFLRRKDEQTLRRFGRGVWEILKARPDTPVTACWVEGGWGSWTSYAGGPPTKGKRPDFRRPIGVGVTPPERVSADVLQNHLQTRVALMNRVLAAREHLHLPPLPPVELPTRDDEPAGER